MAARDSEDPEKLPESEKSPLMRRLSKKMTTTFGATEDTYPAVPKVEQENIAWDSSDYNMGAVNSWRIFFVMSGSVFDNLTILKCMLFSLLISIGVACVTYHSEVALFIGADRVHALGTFLNVFVGMLLGFFVSSAMNRWHGCVQGFMELLEAVRCMQMQMVALGVDNERIDMLNRYGLSSAWLLHLSLNNECRKNPRIETLHESEDEQKQKLWTLMHQFRPHLVNSQEKKLLYEYKECYALLWTWVASLIGRMAQDGEIPPMASPTYGRIINIVEWAYSSIRTVKMSERIKAPFIYVHTLAILVHVNTMLNAISFGLILGMTVQVAAGKADGKWNQKLPHLVSSLCMQFCISMVAPFLYLCLLEVSVCISQPFTFMDSKIPSHQLVLNLEEDLANAKEMAENTKWEKPHFKK